ncbi:MAG: ABC transporter ATP-binding protein [Candidatus Eisenbacteria bacterium]|nr:ABC transporter ATP-binding protein [Candidatus Eisenbacteria bacterium]
MRLTLQPFPYLRALAPYLRAHRGDLVWGTVWVLLKSAAILVVPWILKHGIDRLQAGATPRELLYHALAIVAAAGISGVFLYFMRWVLIGLSRKVEYEVRRDFFDHLVRLSTPFFLRHRTGDLMARATNDLNAVRDVLGPAIMYGLNTTVTVIASAILMVRLDPVLALASMAPVPVLAYAVARFAREMQDRSIEVQDEYGRLSNAAQENLAGMRVVQTYGQEAAESAHFSESSRVYLDKNMALVQYRALFTSTTSVLAGVGTLVLLWLGGARVIEGKVTIGELVAFLGYLSQLTWPFISIGWIISVIQRGEAAMKRMLEVWRQEPEIVGGTRTLPHAPSRALSFRNVSFRYGSGPWVLRDVDLEIPAGSTLAIVGRTASGKTSLVNLLSRLQDPTEGRIEIDGAPIDELPLTHLRDQIGMVPQDGFLFSDTLANNLRFGKEDATDEELWNALELARMASDVRDFPKGLETRIGERGITLSGGQRQRMTLARALLREPPILILDDALSAVDKVTEEALLGTIRQVREGRTLLLIAHRISTVRQADRIVVLQAGRIAESGTHDELVEMGGIYADMARRQALSDALEGDTAGDEASAGSERGAAGNGAPRSSTAHNSPSGGDR